MTNPTDEEIMELMPQQIRDALDDAAHTMIGFDSPKVVGACRVILNRHAVNHARTLEDLADALDAPTLLERAMAGDATAAKQFLHEAGFTNKQGQWLPQYQPIPEATND